MKSRDLIDINAVVTVMTAGALVAVAFFFILSAIARPGGFTASMASLEDGGARAESLFRSGERANAFAPGSVCEGGVDTQAAAIKDRVQAAAQGAGVTLASLSAAPAGPGQDGVTLSAVGLQFQANGRYDQTMSLLAQLSNGRPAIFVDAADLVSKTSSVDLKFQGRVFCSASARR
ncbi:MAG TPA: GspMb/PilO family protein [Caulobacteraceae bacterium]